MMFTEVQLPLYRKIEDKTARICVVGLGYIGLPTSAILAKAGFYVVGVDAKDDVVNTVSEGGIHIAESGLAELVGEVWHNGRLSASNEISEADVYIIAVPTPSHHDKSPDLSCVQQAAQQIAVTLKPGALVILESTVPPHCCDNVVAPAIKEVCGLQAGTDYCLAHCPERVIPGKIIIEITQNDRVVGGITPQCAEIAASLYRSFVQGDVITTSATAAEICKLAENTYRDINIAYANELSNICRKYGVDPIEVITLANRHPRVNILQPGIGVGGHCIAVDPWFLVHSAPEIANLIRTAREVNSSRPAQVAEEILRDATPGKPIVLLGLTYKPDVDDVRESPAVEVATIVAEQWNGDVLVVDPNIGTLPRGLSKYQNVRLLDLELLPKYRVSVYLLVNHSAFKEYVGIW